MPEVQSPELRSKLMLWRQQATEGTLSLQDMRDGIKQLRAERLSAAEASAKSKSKSTKKTPEQAQQAASELLDDFLA